MSTVLLCSNEPVLAEGLARVLTHLNGLELCGCCAQLDDVASQIELHKPDIVVLDLTAAFQLAALVRLQESASPAKVVLWVHSVSTELALQAVSLGVRAILRKTVPLETLIRCLTRVDEGELWFDKALTDSFVTARKYSLTRRERQLITLLSQGMKNKEIATAMDISEGTVKVYLSSLFQKLNVKDRFELAMFGLKNLTPGQGLSADDSAACTARSARSIFAQRNPSSTETWPALGDLSYR